MWEVINQNKRSKNAPPLELHLWLGSLLQDFALKLIIQSFFVSRVLISYYLDQNIRGCFCRTSKEYSISAPLYMHTYMHLRLCKLTLYNCKCMEYMHWRVGSYWDNQDPSTRIFAKKVQLLYLSNRNGKCIAFDVVFNLSVLIIQMKILYYGVKLRGCTTERSFVVERKFIFGCMEGNERFWRVLIEVLLTRLRKCIHFIKLLHIFLNRLCAWSITIISCAWWRSSSSVVVLPSPFVVVLLCLALFYSSCDHFWFNTVVPILVSLVF